MKPRSKRIRREVGDALELGEESFLTRPHEEEGINPWPVGKREQEDHAAYQGDDDPC
jgi:hypothetical protein